MENQSININHASASIVAYDNSVDVLMDAFSSVANSKASISLTVVDNSPFDGLKELCEGFGFEYLHNPSNPGFGSSHNLAISKVKNSGVHFIINPDVSFSAETLTKLIEFMDENPDVVCLVPKVVYPDGRLQRLCKLLPSPINLFSRRFLPKLAKFLNVNYELHWFGYDRVVEVPYVSGCFMVVRTDAFKNIGGFDERFFMYLEDTDISRRLSKQGRVVFYPDALVVHRFAKQSYKNRKLLFAHLKSTIQYFNKWGWFFDFERWRTNRNAIGKIKNIINNLD